VERMWLVVVIVGYLVISWAARKTTAGMVWLGHQAELAVAVTALVCSVALAWRAGGVLATGVVSAGRAFVDRPHRRSAATIRTVKPSATGKSAQDRHSRTAVEQDAERRDPPPFVPGSVRARVPRLTDQQRSLREQDGDGGEVASEVGEDVQAEEPSTQLDYSMDPPSRVDPRGTRIPPTVTTGHTLLDQPLGRQSVPSPPRAAPCGSPAAVSGIRENPIPPDWLRVEYFAPTSRQVSLRHATSQRLDLVTIDVWAPTDVPSPLLIRRWQVSVPHDDPHHVDDPHQPGSAFSELVADEVMDHTWPSATRWWRTSDDGTPIRLEAGMAGLNDHLHDVLLARPTEAVAGLVDLPDPVPEVAGEVAGKLRLPLDDVLAGARLVVQLIGAVAGLATGNPAMTCACLKSVAHDAVHDIIAHGVEIIVNDGFDADDKHFSSSPPRAPNQPARSKDARPGTVQDISDRVTRLQEERGMAAMWDETNEWTTPTQSLGSPEREGPGSIGMGR
jgi:hypothetical protein